MKFDDFKTKALALLSACPMRASELAKATGATSAVYSWLKKLVIAGDIVKGEDGVYRLSTNEELSEAFVEERIAEVEVIEMRMPRASMTVSAPDVQNFTVQGGHIVSKSLSTDNVVYSSVLNSVKP